MNVETTLLTAFVLLLATGLVDALTLRCGLVATAGNVVSAVLLTSLYLNVSKFEIEYARLGEYTLWLEADSFWLSLSVLTSWIVVLISLYSIGYMWHDYRRGWYWFFQNLIHVAIMLLLLCGDIITLLIAWNMLELCSYALIGHWHRDEVERHVGEGFTVWKHVHLWSPSAAACRAVIMTSIGTACLLVSLLLLAQEHGSIRLVDFTHCPDVVKILLLVAAFVFSPQFPFSEWLYTAMAGPVPASALIHSVTLVNAGAYLIFKLADILRGDVVYYAQLYVLISAILAGIVGLALREVKAILASSTLIYVSLLLYIALQYVATGHEVYKHLAVVLLAAHGFSKACLFTSCGYLMHMAGTRFLDEVKVFLRFRQGYLAYMLGAVNLFGVAPSTGFVLKELLIGEVERTLDIALLLVIASLSTALLLKIALYLVQLRRVGQDIVHVELHERTMEIATLTLAVMPYALLPLFYNLFSETLRHVQSIIASYVIFTITLLLSLYVFKSELYRKIPSLVYILLKCRFGLTILFDTMVTSCARGIVHIVALTSRAIDSVIHEGRKYLSIMTFMYLRDKMLDRALHEYLPRAIRRVSFTSFTKHVNKLVTDYVLYSIITFIILLLVSCICTFVMS